MPLPLTEIRDRAVRFAHDWCDAASEDAEAKSFWDDFFEVFGLSRRRVAAFEAPVRQLKDGGRTGTGYIDLLWKGKLLVEHKSRGKSLDRAYGQAMDYFPGLREEDLPRYVLVSDFARFRLHDLDSGEEHDFTLAELPKHVGLFGFISGYEARPVRPQDPVNVRAAERMGVLHDELKNAGYVGHDLEVLLVRLLFCLFADDTGIFPTQSLREWVEDRTRDDGSDLGARLVELFGVLDTPEDKRQKHLDELLSALPYVNGQLFAESIRVPAFNPAMRQALIDACALDWSRISPAIFGALFQSIMDKNKRRNLGAHYTSEENILKLIGPLFLDGLREEFEKSKRSAAKLFELQKKLRRLRFLDPACGCGNFLVVAYRELRLLELDILRAVHTSGQRVTDVFHLVQVDVDQFYGIEIEEFPAQIAQVALWLTDHQMNTLVGTEFGEYFARLPLVTAPHVVHGNALRLDWGDVAPAEDIDYVLGNPPFVGHHYQTPEQKRDHAANLAGIDGNGVLDFVANWYVKAAGYMHANPDIRTALVSTNSIVQGEQVGLLWSYLLRHGVRIHFAHRTFQWSNEARGVAAVHCVIIGFGLRDTSNKLLFDYFSPDAAPQRQEVSNINPYLADAANVVLHTRARPICDVPRMLWGNKPTDGGHFILTPDEKRSLLTREPAAEKLIRRYISGGDLLNRRERYCLWLADATPAELRALPSVLERVEAVRRFRSDSDAASTRSFAAHPTLFRQIAQPSTNYLAVPEVSSERRSWIPMAYLPPSVICSNTVQFIPGATLYQFGVLSSGMHMAWVRYVCGRMKSDFRYSNTIVYNNYPWPESPSTEQRAAVESAAQAVLHARERFPDSSLADLYDPLAMPRELFKAHEALDRAVEHAYGKRFDSDARRMAFLFERYQKLTALFVEEAKLKRVTRSRRKP